MSQNGGWIPATPSEMQENRTGGESWDELLGIYSGFLQEDPIQSVAFGGTHKPNLRWDNESTQLSHVRDSTSYVPHQKVDSIAELLGMKGGFAAPNGGGVMWDEASFIRLCSQGDGNWNSYGMGGSMQQQDRILNGNQDVGGYNQQQMQTSGLSVGYGSSYNLNLPPAVEVDPSSSVARHHQLEPATPGQQNLLQNDKIQVSHSSIDETSTNEKSKPDNVVLSQQVEIGEEHTYFVHGSPGASSTLTSTAPEKQISDERNDEGIDLNKTPLQKTPKRRKHRPKVVKEGKPKRTPNPKATPKAKPNTTGEKSTTKRKYVRKKGTKNSTADATNGAEVSNVKYRKKPCKRALNFELEDGGKKIKGGEFDHQADSVGWSTSILNIHNAEVNVQPTSTENVLHQNINNLIHSVNKIPPRESLPVADTASPAAVKERALNVIARSLSNINRSGNQATNGQVHHCIDGGLAQILANTSRQSFDGQWQPNLRNGVQLLEGSSSTRERSHIELTPYEIVSRIWPPAESSKLHQFSEGKSAIIDLTDKTSVVTNQWCTNSTDSGNEFQNQMNEHMAYRHFAEAQNMVFASQRDSQVTPAHVSKKKQAVKQTPSTSVSKKVAGSREYKRNNAAIEDIIERMKHLYIDNGKRVVDEGQIALVPCTGDGALVPFEVFDPIKKQRPRPKVDLDPETNKLWNLLMGKEASEGAETMDDDKQKFWEEERKIFRGRVDSFIARMHLVQGDRRFSKWKGSVVDSVIGVFLTQNVSDHLSSSAFMSLAAKYPAKSTTTRETCCQNPSTEREVIISFPDEGTSCHHREAVIDSSSVIASQLSQYKAETSGRVLEDVISSQSSSENVTFQAFGESGSNSEAEDQVTGSSFSKNNGLLNMYEQDERKQYQVQETETLFPDFTSSVPHYATPIPPSTDLWQKVLVGLDEKEKELLEFLGTDCTSSLTSTHFDAISGISIEHDIFGQNAESSLTDQQSASSNFVNHEFLNKHLEQQMSLPTESQSRNSRHFVNYSQQESSLLTTPAKSADSFSQKRRGKQNPSGNAEASNVRKRKAEKEREKEEPFDWDTLRKQVQSNAGMKARSKDTWDTLDYEAIQNASVREISQTIKERGMNNVLAERMKEFLNRLVKDHGSVDLEWLRDVQPDKAKDYLLSIRGLGLKSVECVRLLTLHHLAFPVDTNVGRIAVRLGWVPLQPLPETLQLHLLELYPMLETIQKYLWPRLCMLDQETLYELHYQLITFGKVFCTKRQPNCNACPMKGECRHFASAFASARLALPGPEEKRVVCSDIPSSSKSGGGFINLMSLPPAEDNLERGAVITGNCEPIIEEPSTPEHSIETLETDIEDLFFEDPEEIPEIKLNIEAFTTNLQSFMEDKMELQEGDMSRALVALTPGFASIPMPKLKHVSRLRTEHRVYELPDSHPLLKGMDRREPDDPSPYLLAIWTPGETADSVQPPVSECSSFKGGICNLETCFSCNSMREAQAQTVRATILIPCRTAMRGSFPLNGTYFQVNEVFADDETSVNPIEVPRSLIWNLPRRTVFFGTSVSTIFKGMSTEDTQFCFWKGFVCVRGFNQKTRAPRPLKARLHLVPSKMAKKNE